MQVEPEESRLTILIADKIGFNSKAVTRDKESHYIMIKESIHHEDIKIISTYAPKHWSTGIYC